MGLIRTKKKALLKLKFHPVPLCIYKPFMYGKCLHLVILHTLAVIYEFYHSQHAVS